MWLISHPSNLLCIYEDNFSFRASSNWSFSIQQQTDISVQSITLHSEIASHKNMHIVHTQMKRGHFVTNPDFSGDNQVKYDVIPK